MTAGVMPASTAEIWAAILAIGAGTFLIRYSFLGLVGRRPLPEGARRLLRYTAVGVIPGLVAPLVAWPAATGGATDPARVIAAVVTLAVALATHRPLVAIAAGALALWAGIAGGP